VARAIRLGAHASFDFFDPVLHGDEKRGGQECSLLRGADITRQSKSMLSRPTPSGKAAGHSRW
jgi:hypothetical protein